MISVHPVTPRRPSQPLDIHGSSLARWPRMLCSHSWREERWRRVTGSCRSGSRCASRVERGCPVRLTYWFRPPPRRRRTEWESVMREYIVRRLVSMVPVLFIVSLISFGLVYVLPGDPALAILGDTGSTERYQALRKELGLDQPL